MGDLTDVFWMDRSPRRVSCGRSESSKDSSAEETAESFLGRPGFFFDGEVSEGPGMSAASLAWRSSGMVAESSVAADRTWVGRAVTGGSLKTAPSSRLFLFSLSAAGSGKTGVKVKSLPGVRGTPALRTGDCEG